MTAHLDIAVGDAIVALDGGGGGDDAARLVLKEAFSELLERRTQGEWPVIRQSLRKGASGQKKA